MDNQNVKRDIPIVDNVCVSYSVTLNDDGSGRGDTPHPFYVQDRSQWAWRVSLKLEDQIWCIPMVFASKRDAIIAARTIAPYFCDCETREQGREVITTRGHDWLRARLTENLRW